MTTHELKTWPGYFEQIICGNKRFELRKNDRNFQPGDKLLLQEYNPARASYTGREVEADVDSVLRHEDWPSALMPGWVVMSLGNIIFEWSLV